MRRFVGRWTLYLSLAVARMLPKSTFWFLLVIIALLSKNASTFFFTSSINTPIVFVHGYHSTPDVWNKFEERLRKNAFNNTYKFDYRYATEEPIYRNSERLYSYLVNNSIVDKAPIFIGHSIGGLVVRSMLSEWNINYNKIILLATPNYGAKYTNLCQQIVMAAFLSEEIKYSCTNAVLDMDGSSDFLKQLNKKTIKHYTTKKLLTYYIHNDELVNPTSAIIKTGLYLAVDTTASSTLNFELVESGGKNHDGIIHHDEVINNALNFITGRVEVIDGGPKLRDGDCTYFIWDHSTVRWDLPKNAPENLKIDIFSEDAEYFDSDLAKYQIREYLDKKVYRFRFFDPVTTTLSEWSSIDFYNTFPNCKSEIKNNEKIITEWN